MQLAAPLCFDFIKQALINRIRGRITISDNSIEGGGVVGCTFNVENCIVVETAPHF